MITLRFPTMRSNEDGINNPNKMKVTYVKVARTAKKRYAV